LANRQVIRAAHLPDFSDPPAVETLLGFHFKQLPGWSVPDFGLFWHKIRKEYPRVEVHPPIANEMGLRFELDPKRVQFHLTSEVPVRCWFIHKSESRIIQVQNSSFIQNWRKSARDVGYLHYDSLKPSFIRMWKLFREFLRSNSVAQPDVTDCEVTYVNHIDRGKGWDRFAQLPEMIPSWSGRTSGTFLPAPVVVSVDAVYPIRDAGKLEIVLQPGVRKPDATETIQLVLTARCRPVSNDLAELSRCLDLGREWVVQGFSDFTSDKMHKIWGMHARKSKRSAKP
jgi:uncharacterized protein (TIGR04255 family)